MSIPITDKFKPKGTGGFALVDAADVEMPDGSRLSDFKGVSPTVTVTAITGGHRVTITDATGTKTFDVMDGEDGQGASITVDSALSTTSENPIQNKAVAQKIAELTDEFSETIENVTEMIPGLDTTLSETGKAADAGAVGETIKQAMQVLDQLAGTIPTETTVYAWIDDYLSEALGGDY